MRIVLVIISVTWAGLWWTPDQQGQQHFQQEEYSAAMES